MLAATVVADVHRTLVGVVAILVVVLARADASIAAIATSAVGKARLAIFVRVAARVRRRWREVVADALLLGVALARAKDAEHAGVARLLVAKRGELAFASLATVARAFVLVVAVVVVVEIRTLSGDALERARLSKRPVTIAVL